MEESKNNSLNGQSEFGSLILGKHYWMKMSGRLLKNMIGFFKVLKEWEVEENDETNSLGE